MKMAGRFHIPLPSEAYGDSAARPGAFDFASAMPGPKPYQSGVPSESATGEKAMCPTTRPSISATSEIVRALAARSSEMIICSV